MQEVLIEPDDVEGQPLTYHDEAMAYKVAATIHPYDAEGRLINPRDDIELLARLRDATEVLYPFSERLIDVGRGLQPLQPERKLYRSLKGAEEDIQYRLNYSIDQLAALFAIEGALIEDGLLTPETDERLKPALLEEYKRKAQLERYLQLKTEKDRPALQRQAISETLKNLRILYMRAHLRRQGLAEEIELEKL